MTSPQFAGYVCWEQSRIQDVINVEATAVDRATFLATHTPLHAIRYETAPSPRQHASEQQLLQDLQDAARRNRHTLVVIKGIPGTGKSHLIRWLEDRYKQQLTAGTERDVVLLIERSHSSLRETLRQIISSGAFDTDAMHHHRRRLEQASNSLSREGFTETLTDAFRIAAIEEGLPEDLDLPLIIAKNFNGFLLDKSVRSALQAPVGPIGRLAQFLTVGTGEQLEPGESPEFVANDLDFPAAVANAVLAGGYDEAKSLTRAIKAKPALRDALARCFNRLKSYAVGQTMQLNVEDVRHIFNDLRRDLRQNGKSLALFIEDITAFSGIDRGLIDVLATQHTGEGNNEYCRILSVVGITDSYYHDQFPDNLKDRVTHRLSLNALGPTSNQEAELLQDSVIIPELSARYLNAIRLHSRDLDRWTGSGGNPEDIPIACSACPFSGPCHRAFGSVEIGGSSPIGLYPFNQRALTKMYSGLKEAHTPRALLRDVIQHILVNHGPRIEDGDFPPSAAQMATNFQQITLRPGDRTIVDTQAESDRARISTLLAYWGDQTALTQMSGENRTVGDLSEGVFVAFGLPFIDGLKSDETPKVTPTVRGSGGDRTIEPLPKEPEVVKIENPYASDLELWRDGANLQRYSRPRELVVNYLHAAIDWDAADASVAQYKERLNPRNVRIEGQSARVVGDLIEMKRTRRLANALIAMTDLDTITSLSPFQVNGHYRAIKIWIDDVQEEVIEFVRRPKANIPEPKPLLELIISDAILLEWLDGHLSVEHARPEALFQHLVSSAASHMANSDQHTESARYTAEMQLSRTPEWIGLSRRITHRQVTSVHRTLLETLNVPQGTATSVLIVNAPEGLTYVERFLKSGWWLRPLDQEIEAATERWEASLSVHRHFQDTMRTVLASETEFHSERLNTLAKFVGNSTHGEVFEAIDSLLEAYHQHRKPHEFRRNSELSPGDLRSVMGDLRAVASEKSDTRRAILISGATASIQRSTLYLAYFERFSTYFGREALSHIEQAKEIEHGSSQGRTLIEVESAYGSIKQKIRTALGPESMHGDGK